MDLLVITSLTLGPIRHCLFFRSFVESRTTRAHGEMMMGWTTMAKLKARERPV